MSKLAHEVFEKAKRQPTALHAIDFIDAALEAAILGEREACAELVRDVAAEFARGGDICLRATDADAIAGRILARLDSP